MPSEQVDPPRVKEFPVQKEAKLVEVNEMNKDEEGMRGFFLNPEVKNLKVHAEGSVPQIEAEGRVDADR